MVNKRFLEQCEKEALQYSGAIQPHGVLVVADHARRVTHLSRNSAMLAGSGFEVTLGGVLPPAYESIQLSLQAKEGARALRLVETPVGGFFVTATCNKDGLRLFELVESPVVNAGLQWPAPASYEAPPKDDIELDQNRQALVDWVRATTQFKRVMYYAFLSSDDGDVIAESRDPSAYGAYLGLRFPASDIPQIARQLYVKNPWRFIPDTKAAPVSLDGLSKLPPDLSYSDLRSVSPVHLSYLANMGVQASLSIPILSGGKLIALVAAHDNAPHQLSADVLESVAQRVHAHSLAINSYRAQRIKKISTEMLDGFDAMRFLVANPALWDEHWHKIGPWLLEQFSASGAVLHFDRQYWAIGLHPDASIMQTLDEWLCQENQEPVWMSDSLSRTFPLLPLCPVSGALGVRGYRINDVDIPRVFLFREEHVHEVKWGGNPEKPIESSEGHLDIKPRRSFETWVERRLGYCRAWDTEMRQKALKLRELLATESAG